MTTRVPHLQENALSRTLPKAYAWGPGGVLRGWAFSYGRGTPVPNEIVTFPDGPCLSVARYRTNLAHTGIRHPYHPISHSKPNHPPFPHHQPSTTQQRGGKPRTNINPKSYRLSYPDRIGNIIVVGFRAGNTASSMPASPVSNGYSIIYIYIHTYTKK